MADRKVVPGAPAEPTAAQPAEGQASQDQVQQLADAISGALSDIVSKMQKVLMALQKMGVNPEDLQMVAQAYQMFESKVSEVLGVGGEEAPEQEESQPAVVSQEGGATGKPV